MLLPWSERVVPPDSPQRLRRQRATLAARFGSPSMAVARQLSFAVSGWCALSQVLVLGTLGSKTSNHMRSMLCAQWIIKGLAEAPALADVQLEQQFIEPARRGAHRRGTW